MRRSTRKALVNVTFFFAALCFLLFLNRPSSNTKAWNKVLYRTSASKLPETRGICPGIGGTAKPVLVVARVVHDGDGKWIEGLEEKYHPCVYTADAPLNKKSKALQVPANRGHEAMAYLTFLIDNYQHIPQAGAVFVHGSRFAWHNDHPEYDNVVLLKALNVSRALAPWGFHNLRCDWSLSTCPKSFSPQGSLETSAQAVLQPSDARAVSDAALPAALANLFGDESSIPSKGASSVQLGRSSAIRAQCCAQFAVSRSQIHRHSRDEYVALRQWLLDTSKKSAPADDRVAGRILSYVWHILFIEQQQDDGGAGIHLEELNEQACPTAEACYCRLYGRCDLGRCRTESCAGQYTLPEKLTLPDDWARSHS